MSLGWVIDLGQFSKIAMIEVPIAFLVRRFGRCGGMESYVWNLADELSRSGVKIYVICEEVVESICNVSVCVVPESNSPRSYRRLSDFGVYAHEVVTTLRKEIPDLIVHAHERSVNPDVITAHGTLFNPKKNAVKSFFSLRISTWLRLQRNDFVKARKIVPVSSLIADQILDYYGDEFTPKISRPGLPAVDSIKGQQISRSQSALRQSFKVVFVGTEWKRKGLDAVISLCSVLKLVGIELTLEVYGPRPRSLPAKYTAMEWIILHGWSDRIPYEKFDLLMLLSKDEPFGMVVIEALQHGVPCLLSDRVGAARHLESGFMIFKNVVDVQFINDLIALVNSDLTPQPWSSWRDLAEWHVNEIYTPLMVSRDE